VRRLLILGAGGHARAVADVAVACEWEVAGFTDRPGSAAIGEPEWPVRGSDGDLARLAVELRLDGALVGVGTTALRRRLDLLELVRASGLRPPVLVHPRAAVSPSARVGEGSVVFPHVVLGASVTVGVNAVVYSGCVVEHGSSIGDHAYLGPGAVLSGQTAVGALVLIGAGAVVLPGVTIGREAVVAAGAVVTMDVESGVTVLGVPARPRSAVSS
jgi:sugar O-acyltransferase (sialic acid O-acetyltransferase NeuD family)